MLEGSLEIDELEVRIHAADTIATLDGKPDETIFTPRAAPLVLESIEGGLDGDSFAWNNGFCGGGFAAPSAGVVTAILAGFSFSLNSDRSSTLGRFLNDGFTSSGHSVNINSVANEKEGVIELGGASSICSDNTVGVFEYIIAGGDSNRHDAELELGDNVLDASCDLASGASFDNSVGGSVLARTFFLYVRVDTVRSGALISGEVPGAFHPATSTAKGFVGLAE